MNTRDLVTKWLIEESFIVSKLETPIEARLSWSLGVTMPGPLGLRFTVLSPVDKPDRIILVMGIAISPEHRELLEKLKPQEKLRIMHSILSKSLPVCIDCKIAVQPSILNPQSVTINMEIFQEEIEKYGKPFFLRTLTRLINTYLAIVSGFNEHFPVITQRDKDKEFQPFI